MGKIYYNINSHDIRYLEENEVDQHDILFSNLSEKILLFSSTAIKEFPIVDTNKRNQIEIQKYIQNGYKPINKDTYLILTQNYSFCPCCGENIDIHTYTETIVYDIGTDFKNLAYKNIYPAKEITCLKCTYTGLYYYNIYSNKEKRLNFASLSASQGASIYLRYSHKINSVSFARIPILINFSQLIQFFNINDSRNGNTLNFEKPELLPDFFKSLISLSAKDLLTIITNRKLQEIFETESVPLLNNLKLILKPIILGKYSAYKTKKDFELIKKYITIGDCQKQLLSLVLN